MKKRYFIVYMLFLVVLCGAFCFYKLYLLNKFPMVGKASLDETLKNIHELSIKNNKGLANTEFHSMNIFIPEDFIVNAPVNFDSNQITFSHISDSLSKIYLMRSSSRYKSFDKSYKGISSQSIKSILKKYDISHDLDMIDYYQKRVGAKNTIFTSKSRIIADHLSASYLYDQFIIYDIKKDLSILTGDLIGAYGHVQENLSIGIVYNNNDDSEVYSIWIDGMNDDKMKILESIYFK